MEAVVIGATGACGKYLVSSLLQCKVASIESCIINYNHTRHTHRRSKMTQNYIIL